MNRSLAIFFCCALMVLGIHLIAVGSHGEQWWASLVGGPLFCIALVTYIETNHRP